MYKTCKICSRELPLSEDYFYKTGKNRKYFTNICKDCYPSGASSRRKRREEGRSTLADLNHIDMFQYTNKITEIKLQNGCVDCGYNKHAAALDFDHLPGTNKLFAIAHCKFHSWDDILEEIKKCEVVCSNCHRIRTVNRRLNNII